MKKLTIIGAGISGLYAAYLLQNRYDITIIEARDRVGGRIHTIDNKFDMGPSWFWEYNKHLKSLIDEFGLPYFEHYTKGDSVYDTISGLQKFQAPNQTKSYHLNGGMINLVNVLHDRLKNVNMILGEKVIKLEEIGYKVQIITNKNKYESDYVISTLPPRLNIEHFEFEPKLDDKSKRIMQNTPTWMGSVQKVLIEYDKKFWRENNLSGFVYSPLGPLREIHDISEEDNAILFGFMSAREHIREEHITKQLERIFGKDGTEYIDINIINWGEEEYTTTQKDKFGLTMEPRYGYDISHFNNKLFFIGTESDAQFGGYLEGAILSAKKINEKLEA
jgi:monoamine oxidase